MMVMPAQFCPSRSAVGGSLLGSISLLALLSADWTCADSSSILTDHDQTRVTQERIAARLAELYEAQLQAAKAGIARGPAADASAANMTDGKRLPSAAAACESIYALNHARAQLRAASTVISCKLLASNNAPARLPSIWV